MIAARFKLVLGLGVSRNRFQFEARSHRADRMRGFAPSGFLG